MHKTLLFILLALYVSASFATRIGLNRAGGEMPGSAVINGISFLLDHGPTGAQTPDIRRFLDSRDLDGSEDNADQGPFVSEMAMIVNGILFILDRSLPNTLRTALPANVDPKQKGPSNGNDAPLSTPFLIPTTVGADFDAPLKKPVTSELLTLGSETLGDEEDATEFKTSRWVNKLQTMLPNQGRSGSYSDLERPFTIDQKNGIKWFVNLLQSVYEYLDPTVMIFLGIGTLPFASTFILFNLPGRSAYRAVPSYGADKRKNASTARPMRGKT